MSYGAIQIIRDTLMTDFRPLPHMSFGDIVPYGPYMIKKILTGASGMHSSSGFQHPDAGCG